MATAWHRLARAWRRASVAGRIAAGGAAACLVVLCVALAGTVFTATRADGPVPVPPVYLAAVETGAQSCPALTPPKLAAQLMAASGFDPAATTSSGGSGIAGLTDAQWKQWAPSPDAARSDAAANILALAHDTCDLAGRLTAAQVAGEPWRLAMAAHRSGLAPVTSARKVPAGDADYVDRLAGYASWYARQPEFGGAGSGSPSTAGKPGASSAADAAAQPAEAANWTLTWSDEFRGAAGTGPDASKWSHETGGDGWGTHEREYYTAGISNAALDGNGNLAITARADDASGHKCWYGACRYTSARLITAGHFTQLYGRISARIKLPEGKGLWPSFWALGDNIDTVGWPQSGELNVLDTYGDRLTEVSSGLHGPKYDAFATGSSAGDSFADSFHTFSADWYPDHISFAVDGKIFSTQYRARAGAGWVFNHPFFLLLNLAVGGNQPGSPDAGTTFPRQMLVDWVRVYQVGPPAAAATGPITGFGGKCVQAAATVQLSTCAAGDGQTWTLATDGTLRAGGQCLDAGPGAYNGTRPVLATCNGAPGQRWQAQTNGQLVNPGSERCLDATDNNTADGTPAQLWDCWGTANQLWKAP